MSLISAICRPTRKETINRQGMDSGKQNENATVKGIERGLGGECRSGLYELNLKCRL